MTGYDESFLGNDISIPIPKLNETLLKDALNEGQVFDYEHFSLVMSQSRKFALFTAHNVDRSSIKKGLGSISWRKDPEIGFENQHGNEVYYDNPWDRGHMVRRLAVAWGVNEEEARKANNDTYYYSNANLQHRKFNGDEWLLLEDWVLENQDSGNKLCVFTGPVNKENDVIYRNAKIPSAFWKVIVFLKEGELECRSFLMKQSDFWDDENGARFINLKNYQVSLTEITEITGLYFIRELYDSNPLFFFENAETISRDIETPEHINVEQPQDIINEHRNFAHIYESLWELDENRFTVALPNETRNADLILHEQSNFSRGNDRAEFPLFKQINVAKLENSTYRQVKKLMNNYVIKEGEEETISDTELVEINEFMDACFYKDREKSKKRKIIEFAYNYIISESANGGLGFEQKKYEYLSFSTTSFDTDCIDLSSYETFLETTKEIWFGLYTNYFSNETKYSSGFEHIFIGEFDDTSNNIGGYHFWTKFYWDEKGEINDKSQVNYYGSLYRGISRRLGETNRDIATLEMRWEDNGITHKKPLGGFWIGVSPEFLISSGVVAVFENILHKQERRPEWFNNSDFRAMSFNGWRYSVATHRETLKNRKSGFHLRSYWPKLVGNEMTGHSLPETTVEINIGPLVISRILPNPVGSGDLGEWVEILNSSTNPISTDDWKIKIKNKTGSLPSIELNPGQAFKMNVREDENDLSLSNKGATLSLLNPQGEESFKGSYSKVRKKDEGAILSFQ